MREHLLRDELISPDDLNLYQITDDTDQAVKSSRGSTATSISITAIGTFGTVILLLSFCSNIFRQHILLTGSIESGVILGPAKVHESRDDSGKVWISAPIHSGNQTEGVLVIACINACTSESISFLEKAASRIGYFLEDAKLRNSTTRPSETPAEIQ